MATTTKQVRPRSGQYARLFSLGTGSTKGTVLNREQNSAVIIDFPSMPELVELTRSAKYDVTPVQTLPDGIHIYSHTEPMKIPFSFKLSAFDDFCPEGSYTLIDIAAQLHSLALPIGVEMSGGSQNVVDSGNKVTGTDNAIQVKTSVGDVTRSGLRQPAWPAVCFLALMGVARNSRAGIACVGYVETVSVKLKGPFLMGDDESYNLPSSAEYSFTFVHAPSYRNTPFKSTQLNQATSTNAYAGDVGSLFYRTYELALNSAAGIQPIVKTTR